MVPPPPRGFDRGVKSLHLRSRVVVVVLALDVVPDEGEQPRDRVAVGGVPSRRDGQRACGVGGDHLDLDPLGVAGCAATERCACAEDLEQPCDQPFIRYAQVEESRPRGLGALDQLMLERLAPDARGDVARRTALGRREPERDVRRVVAVLEIAGTLEGHRDTGDLRRATARRETGSATGTAQS